MTEIGQILVGCCVLIAAIAVPVLLGALISEFRMLQQDWSDD